jgi:hypothetical protein
MSGAQTSTFPSMNDLLAPMAAYDVHANALLQQQKDTQALTDHDIAMTGQAAAPLLNMNEDQAAAAYPGWRQEMQSRGLAKYAPETYPGHAATAALVQRAMPLMDQFKAGFVTTPEQKAMIDRAWSGTPPTAPAAASGGGTNAPPGTSTPATPQNLADIHPDLTQFTLPSGVGATVAKSAAPQFQGLLTDLEAAGYKLDPNTTGGYNPRTIAGTNTPSQHAYGLAMDVNWQRNPRGANTQADIPPDLARKLAAKWGLTWGGDWQGADRDPMHFEVARGTGPGTDHPAGVATGWNANNPLNLTANAGGVVTPGGARLASFGSMADGVAATAAKLQSYQTDGGLDTVRKIYTEWHKGSPVNDADMQRIAGALGVGVDQPVQLDPAKTAAWIAAAQPGETGTAGKRLSQADITAGVRQASAGPVAPAGGVAARVGGIDVAGPGAGPSGAPRQPAGDDLVGPRPLPPIGAGSPVVTPQLLANTPAPQPQAQIPQPPANRVMPGGTDGPPAATPPPPVQQPVPRQPLATGVNSPQYQQGMQFKRQAAAMKMAPGYALSPQMQAAAAWLDTQGDGMMKLETFQEDTQGGVHGQRNVLTNQFTPDPARRMMATESGDVINDQGRVIFHVNPVQLEKDAEGQYWYVPKYPTPGPGGALVPPQPAGGNMPTPAFAEEQKVEATRLSKLRSEVLDRAKESAQANTMIANTETALQEAQKGNLGAGALSPDKLRIVATAKALGINLAPFGIDADKLGAAQVTREQLQQLNGAILRKMYPQRITNADLAISGTVLPNYGLDPEALTSNFEIYKRQNDYDTRMAQDMLDYQDQHHSLVGWENQWHKKAGFGAGPIDNLFGDAQAGKLTSSGGGGNKPSTTTTTPQIQEGQTATGQDGHKIIFRGGQWVPL